MHADYNNRFYTINSNYYEYPTLTINPHGVSVVAAAIGVKLGGKQTLADVCNPSTTRDANDR